MFRTIAVATDGSDTAQKAVSAAFTLAKRYEAEVVILTAYSVNATDGGVWASNSSTQAERVLADAEEAAAAEGLACSSAMREGDPAEVIVSLAARAQRRPARRRQRGDEPTAAGQRPEHGHAQGHLLGPAGQDRPERPAQRTTESTTV